jgi:hypothetical protein
LKREQLFNPKILLLRKTQQLRANRKRRFPAGGPVSPGEEKVIKEGEEREAELLLVHKLQSQHQPLREQGKRRPSHLKILRMKRICRPQTLLLVQAQAALKSNQRGLTKRVQAKRQMLQVQGPCLKLQARAHRTLQLIMSLSKLEK